MHIINHGKLPCDESLIDEDINLPYPRIMQIAFQKDSVWFSLSFFIRKMRLRNSGLRMCIFILLLVFIDFIYRMHDLHTLTAEFTVQFLHKFTIFNMKLILEYLLYANN